MRPLSPCHLQVISNPSGVRVSWTRRSQRSWAWLDGVESDDDGIAEQYRVALNGPGGSLTIDTMVRSIVVGWPDMPAASGQRLDVAISRIGLFAASQAATTFLII